MTKSLVTGGAGFIGSNLVDQLIEIGHQVIVIDNEYSDAHEQFYYNDKAEYHNFDIRDAATRSLYDDVEEYTNLLTPASLAYCNTVHVPTELILTASIGFSIDGPIRASAAM